MKKKHKFYLEMFLLAASIAIIIMPGMFLVNILAHESYHVVSHSQYAEKIYFDLNSKTLARTIIEFPDSSMNNLTKKEIEKEEKLATRIGNAAAVIYLFLIALIIFWLITFWRKHE